MNKKRLRSFRKKENLEEKRVPAMEITEKCNVQNVDDQSLGVKQKR